MKTDGFNFVNYTVSDVQMRSMSENSCALYVFAWFFMHVNIANTASEVYYHIYSTPLSIQHEGEVYTFYFVATVF